MAQTVYPENGDGADATVHQNLTAGMLCGASFVVYGYLATDNGGLEVSISAGAAVIGGKLVHDTTATTLALTDDDTRYVYLVNDGTFEQSASADPNRDEKLLIAVVITSGGSISSIDYELFDTSHQNGSYTPAVLSLLSGTITQEILLVKDADETINSDATINEDTDFGWTTGTNQKWEFEYVIEVNSGTTPDWKYALDKTGSASGYHWVENPDGSKGTLTALGTTETAVTTSGSDELVVIRGWMVTGSNGLGLSFSWAQNTSDAGDTIVRAGSYMKAKRILF